MKFDNKGRLDKIRDNTPEELKRLNQWGYYHVYFDKEEKKKKKLILSAQPNRKFLNLKDSQTWSSFDRALEEAYEKNASGLSLVLTKENNITCVDLDHQYDKEKREWSDMSKELIKAAGNTFIEKSYSTSGLHIFTKGVFLDETYKKKNDELGIECYSDRKIISITANHFSEKNMTLKENTVEYELKVKSYIGKYNIIKKETESTEFLDRRQVIDNIEKSKKRNDFHSLFYYGSHNYESQSQADFALLNILAFFTKGDKYLMEDIFKESALYRPKKGKKYLETSINKACSLISSYYHQKKKESYK